MCFTGAPGTGKTTAALQMADLLHRLGYLEKGHLVHAMRDDLVGAYIGHTPPKTKRVLEQAIGRAMLDRASYYLSAEAESAFRDYLTLRIRQPRFANARSVRNELERARLRHAHRLASDPDLSRSKDDLMRIESADILSSPVFALAASLSAMEESASSEPVMSWPGDGLPGGGPAGPELTPARLAWSGSAVSPRRLPRRRGRRWSA